MSRWRDWMGESYWAWRLYHSVVSDAVSLQRPTKFSVVYQFVNNNLGHVADVGCGPGVFLRYLCRHARDVIAVDADSSTLKRVRARHHDLRNLHCVVAQVDQLPFENGELDTVLLLEVLEHLSDDDAGIREIGRILTQGGRLVISVPVPPGEVNYNDRWGHKREGYTLDELETLLKNHGFEIQDHSFAQFKFSRAAERLVKNWRRWLRLPPPILLSWVCYLDHFLSRDARKAGGCFPACIVILAKKI